MKQEISAACNLLTSYIQRFGSIKPEIIEQFRIELENVLTKRYEGHWYPGELFDLIEFYHLLVNVFSI